MTKLTRKRFLKAAAVSLAGVAGFFYPGMGTAFGAIPAPRRDGEASLPAAPGEVRRPDGPDPTFAGGEVVAKTADGLILSSAAGVRAVHVPPGTVVWKEFDVGPEAIDLHDWVDVKGAPRPDGVLVARSGWIWVNIGRRDGVVQGLTDRGLIVKHKKGTDTFELSTKLEIISAVTGLPLPGGVSALTPGTRIGTVGLRLRGGGYRATRIWTAPPE